MYVCYRYTIKNRSMLCTIILSITLLYGLTLSLSLYDAAGSTSTSATFGINLNNELYYTTPSFWLVPIHIYLYPHPILSNCVDKPAK